MPYTYRRICIVLNIFDLQQFVLASEREEVREERVEVRFGAEVEDLGVVRVVDMCKDAQELTIDMFNC